MKFIGKKCPVCEAEFQENDDIVVCPRCGAPYHRDCYQQKGKCIFPELHKKGEAWKSDEPEEEISEEDEFNECLSCGFKNPKDAFVCEKCGEFLKPAVPGAKSKKIHFGGIEAGFTEFDGNDEDGEESPGGFPLPPGLHISAEIPGTKPDEDFDGVSGKEMVKNLGQNSLYYLPIFYRIKEFNTSRFNFAAFIFSGGWYLYRKQYLKGTLITMLTLAVNAAQLLITYFYSGAMWQRAFEELGAKSTIPYYSYIEWMSNNCTLLGSVLMVLPYVLSIVSWVIIIACGLTANRSYYKFSRKKIKKIKEQNPDASEEEILGIISRKGGVNNGLAFMLIACELILTVASLMFTSVG